MAPSEKIQICLDMKNLKRKDLATAANMPASTISDFLNGKTTKLDITKAQSIANTLGCTLDYLVGDDTIGVDISTALKAEREEHGETTDIVSLNTKIPEALIMKYEHGDEPVSFFLFGKLCEHYDLSVWDFLQKYDFYDEYIPPHFNGDAGAYEAFKKAEREDALKSSAGYPELRDIVEKGMYVVNGQPARRSFYRDLHLDVERIYMHPYAVWAPNENIKGDEEAAVEEFVSVTKQYATDAQVANLEHALANAKNLDERVKTAMAYYYEIVIDR